MSRDNDWFFESFKGTSKPRPNGHAAVVMVILWLFIIVGVVGSLATAL